jgi:hypothetical protein
MGQLHRQQSGSGEILSFEYDQKWLEKPEVFSFDPDLALDLRPGIAPNNGLNGG